MDSIINQVKDNSTGIAMIPYDQNFEARLKAWLKEELSRQEEIIRNKTKFIEIPVPETVLAEEWDISVPTLKQWAESNLIVPVIIGKKRMYFRSMIRNMAIAQLPEDTLKYLDD